MNAARKTIGGKRVGAGRPATGHNPSRTFRLSDEFMAALDAWAARQNDVPTRSEAIRRLVEIGLTGKTEAKTVGKPGRRRRAQELAAKAIEKMIDPSASPDEREQRRRRLTKGPPEFREDRIDQPKRKG